MGAWASFARLAAICAVCVGCSASGSLDGLDASGSGGSGAGTGAANGGSGAGFGSGGSNAGGCQAAEDAPSNLGCEFFAVDLDLSDGISDPANYAWGVVLANAGETNAHVVIEQNDAPQGETPSPSVIWEADIAPDDLAEVSMPTREVDCAATPGDWGSPGSCLSSHAFRISSSQPIVVYQFNNLVHGFSTDASLLLPTSAVGSKYRVTGWPVAHSFPSPGAFVQRSYVTVVGTQPGTGVTVKAGWRIRGNGAVPATAAGESLSMTIGPFDVLNLESDDATLNECVSMQTPPYCADMTGTIVEADAPVVVFSGTEQSGVGLPEDAPKPPSWNEESSGCCNQHLEEQLFPAESFGRKFLVTRSPIRSNPEFTWWEEPDVIRFVGAAATAQVTTNLPAPYDAFTLAPGQVIDTWSQSDFVVSASEPIVVAQFLVSQGYVEPQPKGDPSFTIFPPIEQARSDYVFLSPNGWEDNYVVIGAAPGTNVTLDGQPTTGCTVHGAGDIDGVGYEARRCFVQPGVHRLSGDGPFQIMAYGYASADAYSFSGGSNIEKIYEVPELY